MQAPGGRLSWRQGGEHDHLVARWTRLLCHDPPLQTGLDVSLAGSHYRAEEESLLIIPLWDANQFTTPIGGGGGGYLSYDSITINLYPFIFPLLRLLAPLNQGDCY